MSHQRVSYGEAACYGHDPDFGASRTGSRVQPKRYRIKKGRVALLFALLIIAIAGYQVETTASSVKMSDYGALTFFFAALLLAGTLADPVIRRSWRRKHD